MPVAKQKDSRVGIHVRVPSELYDKLKATHRATYPQHGMKWNDWLVKQLSKLK